MIQAHSDEWGIVSANTFGFKALILPGSSRKDEVFIQSLQAMHEIGLGTLYVFSNKPYFEIWDFDGAQSGWIREDRRTEGRVPRYSHDNNDLEIMPGLSRKNLEEPGNTVKTLPYSTLLSNKDKTLERSPKTPPKKSKFKKPTPREVEAYAETIDFHIDGHAFSDFYDAKGWLVGKTPMKDWKAAVRNWKRRDMKTQSDAVTNKGRGIDIFQEAKREMRHDQALYAIVHDKWEVKLKDYPEQWEELRRWMNERWPPEQLEEAEKGGEAVPPGEVKKLLEGLDRPHRKIPSLEGGDE